MMTLQMRTEKARVVVMPAKTARGTVTTKRKGTTKAYTGFISAIVPMVCEIATFFLDVFFFGVFFAAES